MSSTPIGTLFVANRGEIARRIIRTAHEMGIATVGGYVPADSAAPFVAEVGAAYALAAGGYLDPAALIEVALRAGADAVHPGYGYLSERAAFAQAVLDAGLIWVGPPPAAVAAMGDKIAAKDLAGKVGVATLPMSDDPRDAADVGYPVLVKAAAGGGGKGMRIVTAPVELADALAAARREAKAAFGDERIFIERFVARSRHVEIQVLGDAHGNLVHLGERECSIQRRHQKILEESPSPVVDETMRAQMGDAALRLAAALGYVSAGTVEFLVEEQLDAAGRRPFWFLEVNTRLQVEHPVTEAVTGIDIVREQLRIAMGEPLGFAQEQVTMSGHAVEARLYAEDPATGFLPATGTLSVWTPASTPAVRIDSGVEQGSVVGLDFDPMLAKVIAHASTRTEAASRLALALERMHIGGVRTNRAFLATVLRTPEFVAGDTTTDFIERVAPPTRELLSPEVLDRHAVAAAMWLQGRNRADAEVFRWMRSGWRNARLPPSRVALLYEGRRVEVSYRSRRDGSFAVDDDRAARLERWQPDGVELVLDGRRVHARVIRDGHRLLVATEGVDIAFDIEPRFPLPEAPVAAGSLVAPMPGSVLDLRVSLGDVVARGQLLIVLEAMKMEHRVLAATAGTVTEIRVGVGAQVDNGELLLVVEADHEGDGRAES